MDAIEKKLEKILQEVKKRAFDTKTLLDSEDFRKSVAGVIRGTTHE
jgi:hypothetical protein